VVRTGEIVWLVGIRSSRLYRDELRFIKAYRSKHV
jgi:hypothetical protein